MEKVAYQCKNIVASSHTAQNLSRHDLLKWINDSLGLKIQKVETLCSGAVYCQFMNILFPGCLCIKKIKLEATLEYEYISNLKQLQKAFRVVGCDKDVPIEKLIKGRFQENFEFVQWFKRFFDANGDSQFSTPVKSMPKQTDVLSKKKAPQVHAIPIVSDQGASSILKQKQLEKDLKCQIEEFKEREEIIQKEKIFYFNKLRNIEIMCNDLSPDSGIQMDTSVLKEKILAELYATEEEYAPEDEDETY